MDKALPTVAEAVADIPDGATVMIGGFGGSGAPIELIHALIDRFRATGSPADITVINNNAGNGYCGIAAMIKVGMVRKMICSFPRSSNAEAFNEKYLAGEIELDLVPQGTLAERIRAAGAGIPAFYTPTSFGTELAEGKPTEEFDGKMYVRERWLKADFALIKGQDPLMAMAAAKTIAQVSVLGAPGSIDPQEVITPGIFVDAIVEVAEPQQEEVLVRTGVVY